MAAVLELSTLTADRFAPDDYAVFGGTFDPVHEGHVQVVRSLAGLLRRVIIAPTAANPWKPEPPTPLAHRVEMLALVLAAEGIPAAAVGSAGVGVSFSPYVFAEELVVELRAALKGELFWAVGADTVSEVHRWRNWDALQVPVIVVPVVQEVHATEIRAGTKPLHPALDEYARAHHLYGH